MEQQFAAAAVHRHKHGRKTIPSKVVTSIIDGLKQIYFHKVSWSHAAALKSRGCVARE